jgi:hypothetical protein
MITLKDERREKRGEDMGRKLEEIMKLLKDLRGGK